MSQSSATIQNQTNPIQLFVSFKILLAIYAIIPLCLLIQFVDGLFFQQQLLAILPSSPAHFILLQVLLGTPHIIASAVLVTSNREYLQFYKTKLLVMTVLIIAVFGVGSLFIPYKVLYIITACWTVYHVLKQQHGVARGLCQLPTREFYTQLWLSIAAGIFIYMGIFLKNSLSVQEAEWIKHAAAGLTISLVCASFLAQRYIKSGLGKGFLWGNTLLIVSSFYFYIQEYYFLAILMPRLIHDATAYIFYISHDYNKHQQQPQNSLYRLAARCNVHVFLVLPLLSLALTAILQIYGDDLISFISETLFKVEIRQAISLGLIGYLSLMHYYSESFLWKHDSPLRAFIGFKK